LDVFGKNYNYITGGFMRMGTAAREYGQDVAHERLYGSVSITEPGYVYIYLSNEETTPVEVYFDDFKVDQVKLPVIQMEDYYPFGLTFNSYRRENSVENKVRFQGQEHIDDLNLEWVSFKWRNHDPAIGRFFNVDPLAEKYVYNSVYAFSENKVVAHIELEGLEAVRSPRAVASQVKPHGHLPSNMRTGAFVVSNPTAAVRIGMHSTGETNISTNAVRFSTRGNVLNENNAREGSQINAFRHTLWQATITSEFSAATAAQIGNAHEENPTPDLNQRNFKTLKEADQSIDLLNNQIGRGLGEQNAGTGMQGLATEVLNTFANTGLWTASKNENGTWSIQQTKITAEQHQQLLQIFQNLNDNGRTAEEQQQQEQQNQNQR
jgi:RHS repeat-associated protein